MAVAEGFAPFSHPRLPIQGQTWYRTIGDPKGSKRPLIVVHGGPGGVHDYLTPYFSDLPERTGIPVILYDQVGNGNSTHLRETKYDANVWRLEVFLAELDNLLGVLNIADNYDLFGHSWGGEVVAEFAVRYQPTGLKHLIIASAPVSVETLIAVVKDHIRGLPQTTQEAIWVAEAEQNYKSPAYKAAMFEFFKRHMCNFWPWPKGLLTFFEKAESDDTVEGTIYGPSLINATGTHKDWSLVKDAVKIDKPTLVITGEGDFCYPTAIEPWANIPTADIVIMEGATHMPHLERPEEFTTHLLEFLAK